MDAKGYLELLKRPVEEIEVPQFGKVFVRGLSMAEYDRVETLSVSDLPDGKKTFTMNTAALIRFGMVASEKGECVFGDNDLATLANLPAEVARPLRNKILQLSGVGAELGKS
jgi:hypothetical protein